MDCVLEPTKQKVLDFLPKARAMKIKNIEPLLNKEGGFKFHNTSPFTFSKLTADSANITANLRNFINGFSASGREIIEYFSFNDQITRLDEKGIETGILFTFVCNLNLEFGISRETQVLLGYSLSGL